MTDIAAPAIGGRTVEGERFPYLSHRSVADIAREPGDLFCAPDRVSTVPILHGFGTSNCWMFLFIIPGGSQ